MLLSASLLAFQIVFVSLLPLPLKPILSQAYMASSSTFLLRNSCLISHVFGSWKWYPPYLQSQQMQLDSEVHGEWTAGRTKARTDEWGHLDLRGWSDPDGRLHSWLEIREKLGWKKSPAIKKKELEVTDLNVKECLTRCRGRLTLICGENSLKKCGFNETHLQCFLKTLKTLKRF